MYKEYGTSRVSAKICAKKQVQHWSSSQTDLGRGCARIRTVVDEEVQVARRGQRNNPLTSNATNFKRIELVPLK